MVKLQGYILKTVTTILPSFETQSQNWNYIKGLKLADQIFLTPRPIDIIIGADHYRQIIKPNILKHSDSAPIAQFLIFGWLVLAPVQTTSTTHCSVHNATIQYDDTATQELLTKSGYRKNCPGTTPISSQSKNRSAKSTFWPLTYEIHLDATSSAFHSNHHSPVWETHTVRRSLPLELMLKRLSRDETLHNLYHQFMREYEELSHMVKAPPITQPGAALYYLPHHGVLKPNSTTTKLRMVFNGFCPTSTGKSINHLMHTGENLLLHISDVLIRIRHHRHIFATDIIKMYRQLKVHEDDWDLQRILWIDGELKETAYQLTTVTYETKAALFLAVRALLQLVDDEGHRFPLAVPSLKHGRYVDDIFGGAESTQELIEIAQQLKELCNVGGFSLAKWHSNTLELLKTVSSTDNSSSIISLDDCMTEILGLKWLSQEKKFIFASKFGSPPEKLTKRLILSVVAQIFDPLGFISPVGIRALSKTLAT